MANLVTHVVIGGIDITPYIVDGTYDINSEDSYESWNDGNMVEHRVIVTQKVIGSFDIVCCWKTIMPNEFAELINRLDNNGVLTIGLFVPTKSSFKAVSCYYNITSKEHNLDAHGNPIDIFTISLKER